MNKLPKTIKLLTFIGIYLTSCQSDKRIGNNNITTEQLEGGWYCFQEELINPESNDTTRRGRDIYNHYYFTSDSIYNLNYPSDLGWSGKYILQRDKMRTLSEYSNWIDTNLYSVEFKGDTLLMIEYWNRVNGKKTLRRLIPYDADIDSIHYLATHLVNWSMYLELWYVLDGTVSQHEIEIGGFHCGFKKPDRLDLRPENELNFSFDRDLLTYVENSDTSKFQFGYFSGSLHLRHVCERECNGIFISYYDGYAVGI